MRDDLMSKSRRFFPGLFAGPFLCMALIALVLATPAGFADDTDEQEIREDKFLTLVDEPELDLPQLANIFRPHCVRVYIHGKTHEGKYPTVGDFADDIRHERSTPVGGYWWDERHVVIADPVLPDHFIRYVEVGLPASPKLYRAKVVGRFIKLQAMLLEVLPDENGELPEAHPLEFIEWEDQEASVLSYVWDEGEWRIASDPGLGTPTVSDTGVHAVKFSGQGVFVAEDGQPLALAFGDRAIVDDEFSYWTGRDIPYTPLFMRNEMQHAEEKLSGQLAEAVLETRFRIRVKIDDEDEDAGTRGWTPEMSDGQMRGGDAEVRAPALVVGKRHLLVPVALPPEGIARIEEITVLTPDGREIPAGFVGAFREYMAVFLETKENLPTQNLPAGFGLLNPLAPEADAKNEESMRPIMQYIQRWRIDYTLGRRREVRDYDRWMGTFRGYRGDTVVLTKTNEGDGSLAFDTEGNLVAIALTPRIMKSRDRNRRATVEATPGFRPLDFIQEKLRAGDAFDPSLTPVDEDQGQRLVDLGVEFQPLDRNLAQRFQASRATRGGHIGLLVTYVYPDSPAAKLGVEENDILLRITLDGKKEPMELRTSGFSFSGGFDIGDMASDSFQSFIRYMPPPWPSRDNVVSSLLTAAGPGRNAVLEYIRDGETAKADFVTAYFEADYRSAKKEKFDALGLTVKPITFEVARFFGRPDQSGVIVSKVEVGGKSSVAGMHHYLLITHVNGQKVTDVDDFRAKLQPFEKSEAASVELTVDGFGKTRLVKIE